MQGVPAKRDRGRQRTEEGHGGGNKLFLFGENGREQK